MRIKPCPAVVSATRTYAVTAALLTLLVMSSPASGSGLVLTSAGSTAGFTLTTFASNFPTTCSFPCVGLGTAGVVVTSSGTVLVDDVFGNVRVFPDVDGQNAMSVTPSAFYGGGAGTDGLAEANGKLYMAEFGFQKVVQINPDGSFNQDIVSLPSGFNASGIAAYRNGLLVTAADFNGLPPGGGIFFVDPRAKTVTTLFATIAALGVAVDASTNNAFFSLNDLGTAIGLNPSKKLVFVKGPIAQGADAAVLGTGSLTNDLFVTSRGSGDLVEIDLTTGVATKIAEGGSGANLGTQDPSSGTLLFTFGDTVYRLSGGGL